MPAAQHVAAPERIEVIGEDQRLSASGEPCRYAALVVGEGARLDGELESWPSKERMANILRAAGLSVTVGVYSIRVEGYSRFKFQGYGGNLSEPVIDADAESVPELLATARLVSEALAHAGGRSAFPAY